MIRCEGLRKPHGRSLIKPHIGRGIMYSAKVIRGERVRASAIVPGFFNKGNVMSELELPKGEVLLSPEPMGRMWKISTFFLKRSNQKRYFGSIKHKCEFNYNKHTPDDYGQGGYFPCLHYGCNIVSIKDKDGEWLDPVLRDDWMP